MKRSRILLTAALLVGTISSVEGFDTFGPKWIDGAVPYHINPNFPNTALAGTPQQQIDVLRCAADTWRNQSSADFRFFYQGTTTVSVVDDDDGVNSVHWIDEDGGDAVAITVFQFARKRGQGARLVAVGFDIQFFARVLGTTINWISGDDPTPNTVDIAGVAVHEFGHALGLDHSGDEAATMFSQIGNRGVTFRTLHLDDIVGVEFLYEPQEVRDASPAILSVEPDNGPAEGGNEVLLGGFNFTWTADTILAIGGTTLSRSRWDVVNCDLIRISSMIGHGSGPVSIVMANELGSVTVPDGYRFAPEAPVVAVTSIEPAEGPVTGGILVTLTGSNLTADAVILVGDNALQNVQLTDEGTLVGTLPPIDSGGTVDVTVEQGADTVVLPDSFTYVSKLLRIEEVPANPGQRRVPARVFASTDEALLEFSFPFSYDTDLLTVDEVSVEGTLAEEADFATPVIDNETGLTTLNVIMSFSTDTPSIPVGEDQEVAVIFATVAAEVPVGTEIPLQLEDEGGSPSVSLLVSPLGDGALRPFPVHGKVSVVDRPLFLRGDADASGKLTIADVVFHLAALFLEGPQSACPDAADVNDDGAPDISDAIFGLRYLFVDGSQPPVPYPDPGVDPTDDGLQCGM